MLKHIFWTLLLALCGCIPPTSEPDPTDPTAQNPTIQNPTTQNPTTTPPVLTEPPELPPLGEIPMLLHDAHALLVQNKAVEAVTACVQTVAEIRDTLMEALRVARIDGAAADAQRVRDLLAEHVYAKPPLLVLARDRFVLAPDAQRLCVRAAWLGGREDLRALWLEDLGDALQAAPVP
jgi:hypothetical protein